MGDWYDNRPQNNNPRSTYAEPPQQRAPSYIDRTLDQLKPPRAYSHVQERHDAQSVGHPSGESGRSSQHEANHSHNQLSGAGAESRSSLRAAPSIAVRICPAKQPSPICTNLIHPH